MKYIEFVEKYQSNKIKVDIDVEKAGLLYKEKGLLPQNFRAEQAKIRTFLFIGILLGLVSFLFIPWWAALVVLVSSFFISIKAQDKAGEHVLIASLADPRVYEFASSKNVFKIENIT